MQTIENDRLKVVINEKGAELNSIYSKETNLEYLWSGDAAFWAKKSPVLFPIVGTLKNNTYFYNNKAYKLSRHGFARDKNFVVSEKYRESVTLALESDESTLADYPFPFRLEISYSIDGNTLATRYRVVNTGSNNMYFSIGGHPAFRNPLEKGHVYEDHYFEFDHIENASRWLISGEGLIEPVTVPILINSKILRINRDLFSKDAIVLKYLNSTKVNLRCDHSKHGIEFVFTGFPFLGLWAAPGADFVCIEPWCGIADATTSNQQLINKEGINLLTPEQVFERTWRALFY
jgi:galactose mutarotase-like enzyme